MFIDDTAWAEIDLGALQHNAALVRRLAPGARIMAMLKANAYGHGLLDCAAALHEQVDGLAVARLEEAEQLRAVYPQVPILLTAATLDREALRWCADRRVAVVVHEARVLALLLERESPPPVWLKLNTGMNRLGFAAPAFREAVQALRARGCSPVAMTHFSSADEPEADATAEQIRRFDAALQGLPALPQSLANSAGLIAFPEARRDWVRPGIMLYGANPLLDRALPELRGVMQFKARVLSVSDVEPGAAVGYGRTWTARHAGRIATLGVGYGDGYPRSAGNRAEVWIQGRRHRLVGRVSMDLMVADISGREDIAVGDEVTLWGGPMPVEDVAAAAGTISYELLCRVQSRVRRIIKRGPD